MTKRILILIAMLVLSACVFAQGAEVKWFKGDLNKAMEAAKKENKIIFIDFYAVWCGPCKMLDKSVWKDEDAVERLKQMNVIPMKLDAEKEGADAAKKYGVKGYPTILFLDKNGSEIGRQVGFGGKEQVLGAIRKNSENTKTIDDMKAAYEKNPGDFRTALDLSKKLIASGDEEKTEEAGVMLEKVYTADPDNKMGFGAQAFMDLLSVGLSKLDSEAWQMSFKATRYGAENQKIGLIPGQEPIDFSDYYNSLSFVYNGAVKAKSPVVAAKLKEIYEKAKAFKGEKLDIDTEPFQSLLGGDFGSKWGEAGNVVADIAELFKDIVDPETLNVLAFYNYGRQRKLEESFVLSQMSVKMANEPNYLDTLAHLYMSLGQKNKAIETEKQAISILTKEGKAKQSEGFTASAALFEKGELDFLAEGIVPANKELKRAEEKK
jgi:thiol-disulfide isomerase/thioredoxin